MPVCCERRRWSAALAVVVVLAMVSGARGADRPGAAQPTTQNDLFQSLSLGSGKEPVRIDADALELDYKGNTLTYSGNVHVTQGDVTLTSDSLAITYDRDATRRATAPAATASPAPGRGTAAAPNRGDTDKIKEVVAEGHVRIQKGERLAEGRRAVFDQAKQTIVLSDGAVLHEGPNQVAGDRIVVYLQEERSVVESGSNSRVSAVFYPGSAGADAATGGTHKASAGSAGGAHVATPVPSPANMQVGNTTPGEGR